jgi:hypothetical protein
MAISPDGVLTQCASMILGTPENVTTFGSVPFQPACDFANNDFSKLYCMDFSVPAVFSTVDASTCAQTVLGTAGNFQNFSGMAWDATTGTMYGSTTDVFTSNLYTINLANGATTLVGNMTNSPANIAIGIDQNGDLYGYDIVLDSLFSYNKTNGAGTLIGPIGFDANFAQGMDFDHSDNTCYIFGFNALTFAAELRTCDVNTGATTLVGVIGQNTPGGLQEWTGPGILVPDGGCSAEIQVAGGSYAPGAKVPVDVSITHRSPDAAKRAWTLQLVGPDGKVLAALRKDPHTLKPGDTYNGQWKFPLPKNLASGTYKLWLALPGMAGIKGAMTTLVVQ